MLSDLEAEDGLEFFSEAELGLDLVWEYFLMYEGFDD